MYDRQLTPLGIRSSVLSHSGKEIQSQIIPSFIESKGIASVRDMVNMARSRSSSRTGAKPKPQLPSTTDVTPCQPEIVQ